METPSEGVGYIRVRLVQCDNLSSLTGSEMLDPFVAISVKDPENVPGFSLLIYFI